MKLKEVLKEILSKPIEPMDKFGLMDTTLYGEQLTEYKEQILSCDEFSECDELTILKTPMMSIDDKPYSVQTYRLGEGQKFKGKCYLLSLALTPEMYDPNTLHEPVKDGATLTPLLYDPQTFKPNRKIVLNFSPEREMGSSTDPDGDVKRELHELLDKVLDNPSDYTVKGDRGVLVRGVFEKNEIVTQVEPPKYLVSVNTSPDFIYVHYMHKDIKENGEINVTIKPKRIPIKLKEKYEETFKGRMMEISIEDIDNFLKENE